MDSKKRTAKKRVRETDVLKNFEGSKEEIIPSAKRRKTGNNDHVRSEKSSGSGDIKGLRKNDSVPGSKTMSKPVVMSISDEVCPDSTSPSEDADDYIQSFSRNVRKTYSRGNSRRQPKRGKLKVREIASTFAMIGINDENCEMTYKERKSKKVYSKLHSKSLQNTIMNKNASSCVHKYGNQASASKTPDAAMVTRKSRSTENKVQNISDSARERRKTNEKYSKCKTIDILNNKAITSCSQQVQHSVGDISPIVLSSVSSSSHIVANPVTCAMTAILCHPTPTGVPLIQVPSINPSTAPITSVSTPIATLPLLPSRTPDASDSVLERDFSLGHHATYPAHVSANQVGLMVAANSIMYDGSAACVSTGSTSGTASKEKTASAHTSKNSTIPIISIEDDNETLIIEKTFTSSDIDASEFEEEEEGEDASTSSKNSETNGGVSSRTLKLENWGAYLLQKLKILFDQEEDCDLILKFSNGEILKAHRLIISTCTSLLKNNIPSKVKSEITLPPELDFASVKPVLRFLYSGHLDVGESRKKLSAIYLASKKLQVLPLMQLIDRRFPHLHQSQQHYGRRQSCRRSSEKAAKHLRQKHGKSSCKISKSSSCHGKYNSRATKDDKLSDENTECRASSSESQSMTLTHAGLDVSEDEDGTSHSGSLYFLITNSQKIAQANAATRRKRPAETARPTRFELDEEGENESVPIAPWSSSSSKPSYSISSSIEDQESSIFVSNPVAATAVSVSSPTYSSKNTNVTWSRTAMPADHLDSRDVYSAVKMSQSVDSFPVFSQNIHEKKSTLTSSLITSSSNQELLSNCENGDDDDIGRESEELMKKISNICKQLEDGDSDESKSSCEHEKHDDSCSIEPASSEVPRSCSGSVNSSSVEDNSSESSDCIVLDSPSVPTKSILKKKRDKQVEGRTKKRVSFPLDENNELINEVAIYSNAKEPSHSLLDVQKTIGNFRSSEDSPSPVKLTLSLKKKVLMNLTLDGTDSSKSHSSQDNEKGKGTNECLSNGKSSGQNISQGDMTNHAKIISEVLKKYPHLVKDRKNIRLKILKKGTDKNSSGKLVKSKVQYLVLSENDSKAKSSSKYSKGSSTSSKVDGCTLTRLMENTHGFRCPECVDAVFSSYFTFKKHVTSEHKDKCSSILGKVEAVPYACYTCFLNEPLEFPDYCSYQQHMKEMHSKREARTCNLCGFRPGKKLELAYHQYIEHNKLPRNLSFPKCDLCNHVAMNDASLLKHRSKHANADNYTCSVCGVAFRSFGALQGHMQTKLCQNKPSVSHKCPFCQQTFARSYNLKAHCKSNHRAEYLASQAATSLAGDIKKTDVNEKFTFTNNNKSDDDVFEDTKDKVEIENEYESKEMNDESPTMAESSSMANTLTAALDLSEETANHYLYTQGSKYDFAGNETEGNSNLCGRRSTDLNTHLESSVPVSTYSGSLPICHAANFATQTSLSTAAAVGTFYPVGVVPGQIVSGQLVPGEIISSQVLSGACVNVAGNAIVGASPHSWAYVAYQVPTSGDELPSVISDPSTITPVNTEKNSCSVGDLPAEGKTSNNEFTGNSSISGSSDINSSNDNPNPIVVMTNTATQEVTERDILGEGEEKYFPVEESYGEIKDQGKDDSRSLLSIFLAIKQKTARRGVKNGDSRAVQPSFLGNNNFNSNIDNAHKLKGGFFLLYHNINCRQVLFSLHIGTSMEKPAQSYLVLSSEPPGWWLSVVSTELPKIDCWLFVVP
ncbi:hypothetical protein SK128_027824 [Halocaridina rubra]|uniref:BTB domain-containing protein n=1 Tax=Halocaridina rubra TaxID=373956 RepID=A0AAN8X9T8_HALRR